MLTRIFADNFRALVNFEFRPDRLSLLLGGNGSGKSTALEILAILSDIVIRGNAVAPYLAYSRTAWDKRSPQTFELNLLGTTGAKYEYRMVVGRALDGPESPWIESERVLFDGQPLFEFHDGQVHLYDDDLTPGPVFPFRPERSFLSEVSAPGPKLAWFLEFLGGVTMLQINPFIFGVSHEREQPFLQRHTRNFSAFWDYLGGAHPDLREACTQQLREIIPGFQNLRLIRVGDQRQLLVDFSQKHGGTYTVGATNLSEGQRALIALYASLWGLVGHRSIVCFDEPDNFVGLAEIQPWLQALRDRINDSETGQVAIISHHPEVIDYMAADSAFVFDRPAGIVTVKRLADTVEADSPLKLSEIIARGG